MLQTIGVALALAGKAYCWLPLRCVGIFFLAYATLTAIAIAMALFNMAMLYNSAADLAGDD